MNRRAFLGWLAGTAAGVAIAPTLDLERLLWVPGARTIIIPELAGVSRNSFITPTWVVRETLQAFQNQLRLGELFDRQYDRTFDVGDVFTADLSDG